MSNAIDIDGLVADADSTYPALFQLFAGYLNEDWRAEYDTAAAALTAYVDEAPPQAVAEAAAEARRILALELPEESLEELLREGLHCAYLPGADGLTTSQWLAAVRDRLLPATR